TDDYDLTGGLLFLQMPDGAIREVTASKGGSLLSEKLKFEAPKIYFLLEGGELERLVGGRDPEWVPPDTTVSRRAVANAEDFSIAGDSVEITSPAGALESVFAIGKGRAETASKLEVTAETPET